MVVALLVEETSIWRIAEVWTLMSWWYSDAGVLFAGAAFFLLLREGVSRDFRTEYDRIPVGILFIRTSSSSRRGSWGSFDGRRTAERGGRHAP